MLVCDNIGHSKTNGIESVHYEIYRVYFNPVLTYSMEVWALENQSKILAVGITSVRSIVRKTRMDRVRKQT